VHRWAFRTGTLLRRAGGSRRVLRAARPAAKRHTPALATLLATLPAAVSGREPRDLDVRVNVTDLVGRPGATRDVVESVLRSDVGSDPWGPAEDGLQDPIDLDLQLDAVVEGIFVHGSVGFAVELPCARCLEPVEVDREVDVAELFQDPHKLDPEDELEDGYALVDDRTAIDLERMLHDVVVLGLPVRVTCERPECVPYASEDVVLRSEDEHVAQVEARPDPRWAKLTDLDLDD
jgi:uncharacterized protein